MKHKNLHPLHPKKSKQNLTEKDQLHKLLQVVATPKEVLRELLVDLHLHPQVHPLVHLQVIDHHNPLLSNNSAGEMLHP